MELNEFLQSKVKKKLSSVQKISCITAIADKKIINAFYVIGVFCSPSQSAVQIFKVSSAWLYVLLESTTEDKKKLTYNYI